MALSKNLLGELFFFPGIKIITNPCTLSCPNNFLLKIWQWGTSDPFSFHRFWLLEHDTFILTSKPKKANDAHLSLLFSSASTSILTSERKIYDESHCVMPALGDSRHGSRTQGWGKVNEKNGTPW